MHTAQKAQTPPSSPAADPETIRHLNAALKHELTAISQYFLHARMLKHMSYVKLADFEYRESIDEMKHADLLVERILSLGGVPNLQELGALSIGEDVPHILESDLKLEETGRLRLEAALTHCESRKDAVSTNMLRRIIASEDEHVSFIRQQLNLIDTMGLAAYLQTQL